MLKKRGVLTMMLPGVIILLIWLALNAFAASAAPEAAGDLDSGFGVGGKTSFHSIDTVGGFISDSALQADGKVVIVGHSSRQILARCNADGSFDDGFGGNGRVVVNFANTLTLNLNRVAVQSDGKIVVAGAFADYTQGRNTSFLALRYNTNGSIDATFGQQGRVLVDFAGAIASAGDLFIGADGKITLAGIVRSSGSSIYGLARLNSDGSIDTGFGANGKQLVDFGANPNGYFSVATMDAAGRVIIAAYGANDSANGFYLARITTSGALDPQFGSGGITLASFSGYSLNSRALAVDSQGRIVVVGNTQPPAPVAGEPYDGKDLFLTRFLDSGAVDLSFGQAGLVITDFYHDDDIALNVAIMPDNRIIVGGAVLEGGSDTRFALAKYNVDGSLDTSFGEAGKVYNNSIRQNADDIDLLLTSDGKILQLGYDYSPNDSFPHFTLARYDLNGAVDSTFGVGGFVHLIFTSPVGGPLAAALVQPDGKIIAVGLPGRARVMLARFNVDGTLDSGFGDNGQAIANIAGDYDTPRAAVFDNAGNILVVGAGTGKTMLLIRFHADGSLDTSFGAMGKVTLTYDAEIDAVMVTADNKIVIVGGTIPSFFNEFSIARLNSDGSPDATFGDHGVTYTIMDPIPAITNHLPAAVGGLPDGRLLVAGTVEGKGFVARFSADGVLDPTFGASGIALFTFANNTTQSNAMALLADGRILVAGVSADSSGEQSFGLARLNANGALDTGFGQAGTALATFAGSAAPNSMLVENDGRIVLAGNAADASAINNGTSFALARFNSDGSPDTSFGAGGKLVTIFSPAGSTAAAIVQQPNGRLVAAGSLNGPEEGFALAGYRSTGAAPTATPSATSAAPTTTAGPNCLFSDVCPTDYFYAPVRYLLSSGALSGYADNTYRPFVTTTRGQLVKMVVLAANLPIIRPEYPSFNDAPAGSAFYSYIETAASYSLISGYNDGQFRPGNAVTRGQLCKIIVAAAGWNLLNPAMPTFGDVDPTNPFYSAIETAYSHQVISGYDDHTFRWNSNATRGQVAKIVYLATTSAKAKK